jgi:hypothetical protein
MAASQDDSNPNRGGKSAKGMKNNDGRVDGSAWDSQHKAKASFKETFSPNDDARQLPQVGGVQGEP